ncbi:MAG: sulfatase-like hydrolase/transferase [Mariniphaga sp.]
MYRFFKDFQMNNELNHKGSERNLHLAKVTAALVCLYSTAAFSDGNSLLAQVKPNFVFIIADDVSWDDIGCYGNNVVKTPNIDRLAKEGLRFTNAILTASSCSPSRCSIISGKYPHSNGAAELHTPLPEKELPFPLLLKENNYYTAHAGKWHLGPATHRISPFVQ